MDKLKIVYDAIVKEIAERKKQMRLFTEDQESYYNFCQSWWVKTECKMKTAEITRIGKRLAKMGYLEIDYKNTSTSTGTRFLLTDKKYPEDEPKSEINSKDIPKEFYKKFSR